MRTVPPWSLALRGDGIIVASRLDVTSLLRLEGGFGGLERDGTEECPPASDRTGGFARGEAFAEHPLARFVRESSSALQPPRITNRPPMEPFFMSPDSNMVTVKQAARGNV